MLVLFPGLLPRMGGNVAVRMPGTDEEFVTERRHAEFKMNTAGSVAPVLALSGPNLVQTLQRSAVVEASLRARDVAEPSESNSNQTRSSRLVAPLDLKTQTEAQSSTPENTEEIVDEGKGPDGLTEAERQEVQELQRREQEVRQHEQAHATTGGQYTGQPSYTYRMGPDGKLYATGGEVKIDVAAVPNNPRATIRKMEQVKRAALAPSQPSAADRQVAAEAQTKLIRAKTELQEQEREEQIAQAEKREEREVQQSKGAASELKNNELAFDPEKKFRSEKLGTGEIPGAGLIGAGALGVGGKGVLEAGTLFNLVA